MKNAKRVLSIFIVFSILVCNIINIVYALSEEDINQETQKNKKNNEIEETIVDIKYEYKEGTNTVIATMISNTELQDTKVSWELSEDKKSYTFEFDSNTTYTTTVTDIYGNVISVLIDITQIKEETKVDVYYDYNSSTNTVLVTMKSNNELQDTKVSWELSEDKKSYIFEFNSNTRYTTTVTDIYGNVISVLIEVTQIKDLGDLTPGVRVEYKYIASTNTVIATMISNTELQDTKVSWKLSEDKKSYTFEFNSNTRYTTTVTDIYGNVISVPIEVIQIKDLGDLTPGVRVEYKYIASTNTVIATMISNTELQDTKVSWELSEDKKSYTFEFNSNTRYTTTVTDIYGNVISVLIDITQIKEETKVDVYYDYNSSTNTVLVTMKSNNELQDTKVSWELSEDKKQYTFKFTTNTTYTTTVTDVYGEVINVEINVTQIREKTKVNVYYDYNSSTNTVLVTMKSNNELQDTKVSWKLSEDKKQYTFKFTTNTTYTTTVTDVYGVVVVVEINVTEVDDKAPDITQEYLHNDDGTITVTLHSNEKLGNTKPTWKLSEDELSYSKTFSGNYNYETLVQDIWGNEVIVKINILLSNFESLDGTKYPGYKSLLRQVQAQHPDWILTIKYTGLDWNTVIENEYGFGDGSPRSLTQAPYLNEWKSAEDDTKYDVSQSWYRASKSAIAYMMDPRNSLEEAWIFQFQDLGSSAGTRKNIEKMVEGTFLNTDSIIDTILSVAQEQGISPFHLVSRMLQEQHRDGSGIMNGYDYNNGVRVYKVYNLFNINVSGNSSAGIEAGAKYAYDRHWFTPEACIIGSAEFLKKNYISKGQSTLYFQKYNVVDKSNLYNHQYMQNIRAANDEGNMIYKSYRDSGLLDSQFEFVIPVYENMPVTACPRPRT